MNTSKRNMCCVCLDAPNNLYGLWEIDAESVKWSQKLSYSVPEVEWLDHFLICTSCSELVRKICDFKKLCLEADKLRKSLVNTRYITAAENSPASIDNTATAVNNSKEDEHFVSLDIPKASFDPFVVVRVKEEKIEVDNTEDDIKIECVDVETKYEEQEEKSEDPLSVEENDFEESKTVIENCCDQCGLNYTLKEELVEHLHTIHETYKCEFCEETLVGSDNFTSHVSDAHSKKVNTYKIFKCFTCKHRFSSATELYNHGSTHNYTCHQCAKSFRTRGALIVHEKHRHSGLQKKEPKKECTYFCKICQTQFSSYTSMNTHNKAKHTDTETWKYMCTVCNRKFPVKRYYVLHMRRHLGVKPYPCQYCTKTYVSNVELGKHVIAHKNGHPGKCYYCGEEYKQRREMEKHIIKVHNVTLQPARTNKVKKCLCHICNKGFYDNHQLSKHIRTHTGEKPFQCNECEKAFSDNANLRHHLQRMHNRMLK